MSVPLALALAWLAVGQSGSHSMRVIDKGTHSLIGAPRTVFVRTPEEWTRLWREHAPDRPAPSVDSSQETVLAVFGGTKPTAGYAVEIGNMKEEDGALVVEYRISAPARDVITAQILTAPYLIVAVPRREGPIRFAEVKR